VTLIVYNGVFSMNSRLAATAAILLLAGCVSMGPNYDPAMVDTLVPGTPKSEVIARLGRPTSTARLGDGRQQLMWVHSRGSLGRAEARAVTLIFDAEGRYIGLVSQSETSIR
jgi:hypothetical protein